MSRREPVEREYMEFDVVIVGAGPAGRRLPPEAEGRRNR